MHETFWPLGDGRKITSPWGPRQGGFHTGVDFGRAGGSAGMPVYACRGGTVIHAGAASGYGGPDPAGWLVIDHPDADGGGCTEYGHIVREVARGDRVEAGQRIARINPDRWSNAGVDPHLHLSVMPAGYDRNAKINPELWLMAAGAQEPGTPPGTNPTEETNVAKWTGDPVWIEDVLRPALGDRLRVLDGWKTRGHGDFKDIRGVMWHHTGNAKESAESIARGRSDLAGPLSNLHIAPNGIATLVAVGVCWHAGRGSYPWLPIDMANWHMIGVECAWPNIAADGSFDKAQLWPDAQIVTMRDVAAALSLRLDVPADHNIGHKDYAGSAQGKWDPGNLDMRWFQAEVAKDMRGEFDRPFTPAPPAPVEPGPILPPVRNPRTDRVLLEELWDQARGIDGLGWPVLGGLTPVDYLAKIGGNVLTIDDRLRAIEALLKAGV